MIINEREKSWKSEIFRLPITEVHGVHPQLEVRLLFLVKPKKKVKPVNIRLKTTHKNWKEHGS